MQTPHLRVGVDIGGTFTDIVIMDTHAKTTRTHKVLSTPREPAKGMLKGLDELGIARDVEFLVHGTTAGLNAILSRTGERAALVMTKGFGDVLLLGRAGNKDIWSLTPRKPAPLVDPDDIHTVDERIRFDGSIETPLDPNDVAALAERAGRRRCKKCCSVFPALPPQSRSRTGVPQPAPAALAGGFGGVVPRDCTGER